MMGGFPNVFGYTPAQFETLLLVLVRLSAMLSLSPVFSLTQIPRILRIGIALVLAFVVSRTVPPIAPLAGIGDLAVAIVAQVVIGVIYGFVAYLLFAGIQFAGEIIDVQMGFAVVNIINPLTSQSVTVIGEFQIALATLLYLTIDAHHALIGGMASSFRLIPLPFVSLPDVLAGDVIRFFTQSLWIVFQIAAPIAVALFVVNVMLGMMARVAPQMNVFVIGFPLQIAAGLVLLIATIPLLGAVFPVLARQSADNLSTTVRAIGSGTSPLPSPSPTP